MNFFWYKVPIHILVSFTKEATHEDIKNTGVFAYRNNLFRRNPLRGRRTPQGTQTWRSPRASSPSP